MVLVNGYLRYELCLFVEREHLGRVGETGTYTFIILLLRRAWSVQHNESQDRPRHCRCRPSPRDVAAVSGFISSRMPTMTSLGGSNTPSVRIVQPQVFPTCDSDTEQMD